MSEALVVREPTPTEVLDALPKHARHDLTPVVFTTDRDPWERQRGESRQAFAAFTVYLEMALEGERRSIRKASEALGRHPTLLGRWSVKWRWVDRCELWDMALDKIARQRLEHKALELQGRKLEASGAMVGKVLSSVNAMEDDLKPFEAARMAEAAVRLSDGVAVGADAGSQTFVGALMQMARKAKEDRGVTD